MILTYTSLCSTDLKYFLYDKILYCIQGRNPACIRQFKTTLRTETDCMVASFIVSLGDKIAYGYAINGLLHDRVVLKGCITLVNGKFCIHTRRHVACVLLEGLYKDMFKT